MSLKIGVLKETAAHEKRIAVSPDSVKKYISMGATVTVESGAGIGSSFTDDALKTAGAKIVKIKTDILKSSDILLCVQTPDEKDLAALKKDCLLIGILSPYDNDTLLKSLSSKNITGFAMELVPRITRAQSMDILSSQANLAGYKAVLDACEYFNRGFPMMMTAAGTIPPAKVFVMGAGVAGLQAIATAKRLGAVVSATDVRPAAKEQVQSLGGSFVAVEDEEFKEAETAGGYAKEMSAAYKKKQQTLIEETIAKQDIIITTALIPGRPAPVLVTDKMVKSMKPGAVIVDLAAPQGGNCEATVPGKVTEKDGVHVIGHLNVPSRLASSASSLYAKNLQNLVALIVDTEKKALAIDWDDEIVKGITLTHDGKIVHPNFTGASSKSSSATTSAKKAAAKKAPAKTTTTKKPAAKKSPAKKTPAKAAATKKTTPKTAPKSGTKKA